MTPDELRALADALEPMARAPRFEDFDVPAFCAWLRACADAQPVPAGWKLVPVEPTPEMLQAGASIMDFDRSGWYDADVSRAEYRAMLAAAPTAPQAEQPIDLDAVAMQQMRQAAAESTWMPSEYTSNDWIADVYRWLRDGPPAAAPQAEPSAALIRAYNSGYMQGHHDTVEAQFIVIHPLDMDTYHADVVAELGLTAAPQAEPCIGNDSACPCQDGDACHYKDAADGTKAWPVPQAEPKRHGFLDEIDRAKEHVASWPQWMKDATVSAAATLPVTEPKREPLSDEQVLILLRSLAPDVTANLRGYTAIVRAVERHHGIGGSDAE